MLDVLCPHTCPTGLLPREGSVGRDSCVPLQAHAFFGGPPLTALRLPLHSSALALNNVKVNVIPVPWCSAMLLIQAQGPTPLLRVKHPETPSSVLHPAQSPAAPVGIGSTDGVRNVGPGPTSTDIGRMEQPQDKGPRCNASCLPLPWMGMLLHALHPALSGGNASRESCQHRPSPAETGGVGQHGRRQQVPAVSLLGSSPQCCPLPNEMMLCTAPALPPALRQCTARNPAVSLPLTLRDSLCTPRDGQHQLKNSPVPSSHRSVPLH